MLFSSITLTGVLAIHELIGTLGIECTIAWKFIWFIAGIGCAVVPLLFKRYIRKNYKNTNGKSGGLTLNLPIFLFNLLEFTCIQLTFGLFFTTPQKLCYAHDGQIGLELILAGFAAIPILIFFAFYFQRYLNMLIFN